MIHDPVSLGYRNEPFTKGLTDLVNNYRPEILLLGATSIGQDLAGSVATTLLSGLPADCTELTIDPASRALSATRPTFGGSLLYTIMTLAYHPQVATVRPASDGDAAGADGLRRRERNVANDEGDWNCITGTETMGSLRPSGTLFFARVTGQKKDECRKLASATSPNRSPCATTSSFRLINTAGAQLKSEMVYGE
ncbi:electron transfer flavoprotein [Paraburkholderia sp. RAU2J]|nr:electron transfer flavoprotein [Paraburkholderia sp. RAU2J]